LHFSAFAVARFISAYANRQTTDYKPSFLLSTSKRQKREPWTVAISIKASLTISSQYPAPRNRAPSIYLIQEEITAIDALAPKSLRPGMAIAFRKV